MASRLATSGPTNEIPAAATARANAAFSDRKPYPGCKASAFDARAELDEVKHGYEENRRILVEGLPRAGLDSFLPADGAFYLYADVSRFSTDSFAFATRMLEEAGVAATPGVDFDPLRGRNFLRLCYAGSRQEMHEAVERIGAWLKDGPR